MSSSPSGRSEAHLSFERSFHASRNTKEPLNCERGREEDFVEDDDAPAKSPCKSALSIDFGPGAGVSACAGEGDGAGAGGVAGTALVGFVFFVFAFFPVVGGVGSVSRPSSTGVWRDACVVGCAALGLGIERSPAGCVVSFAIFREQASSFGCVGPEHAYLLEAIG